MSETTETEKTGFQMPPALLIVSAIVVLAALATLVLPRGSYERKEQTFGNLVQHVVATGDTRESVAAAFGVPVENVRGTGDLVPGETINVAEAGGLTREAVVPGSFPTEGSTARGPLLDEAGTAFSNAALAPVAGFQDKADIIAFVLLLGGAFGIMLATGALDRLLAWAVLSVGQGWGRWLVVPISMTLFSLGGAVFGMGESTIAFVLITVPLAIRLGFDTVTGVCMCYLASQVGFGGAFFNPFTVGIAQAIAEVPYLSGNGVRYVVWTLATALAIAFVSWHAVRVSRDPKKSPTYALDEATRAKLRRDDAEAQSAAKPPSARDWGVLACVFGSVGLTAWGVQALGWWIPEMAACFVVLGVLAGAIAGSSPRAIVEEFVEGAKLMVEPCLIIAVSAGIVFVLQEGRVLDTILHALAQPLRAMGPGLAAVGMMGMQGGLNFFVPSGSGQAAMTMPIVAPLCDLVGMDRQVGVLAFQFGDGFGNMIIPTSAVLMGVLGVARVDWGAWLKWVWPLVLALHVLGAAVLIIVTYGPASWLH